jgi:hypothetical protein
MPIHDWTKVDAGLFHAFHQRWIASLSDALNGGVLPKDYFALTEQRMPGPIPDVVTLRLPKSKSPGEEGTGGTAVLTAPVNTRVVRRTDADVYADKADRISIRHRHGDVVAIIELVSPGNKSSATALRKFVGKTADLIGAGIHLLVVDPFPPGKHDPAGIHTAIWDEVGSPEGDDDVPPADKPLTLAAYDAGPEKVAYVEFVAVGDELPGMPIFLRPGEYVKVPLEATYRASWEVFPGAVKGLLQSVG